MIGVELDSWKCSRRRGWLYERLSGSEHTILYSVHNGSEHSELWGRKTQKRPPQGPGSCLGQSCASHLAKTQKTKTKHTSCQTRRHAKPAPLQARQDAWEKIIVEVMIDILRITTLIFRTLMITTMFISWYHDDDGDNDYCDKDDSKSAPHLVC